MMHSMTGSASMGGGSADVGMSDMLSAAAGNISAACLGNSSCSSSSSSTAAMSPTMATGAMTMTFFDSHTTPLFWSWWLPQGVSQYAATCLFLAVLAIVTRVVLSLGRYVEFTVWKWQHQHQNHRSFISQTARSFHPWRRQDLDVEAGIHRESSLHVDRAATGPDSARGKEDLYGAQDGHEMPVSVSIDQEKGQDAATHQQHHRYAWSSGPSSHVRLGLLRTFDSGIRPSVMIKVRLTMALYECTAAVLGYFLMLAVMTMNTGYFLSVVTGLFVGTFLLGDMAASGPEHQRRNHC